MPSRASLIGAIAAVVVCVLTLSFWFGHIAPWFMWGIVAQPEGPTVFFDIAPSLRPAYANLESRYTLSRTLPVNPLSVRRLAWQKNPQTELIALVPARGTTPALKQELAQAGWRYRRLGGLMIAQRGQLPAHNAFSTRTLLRQGARELARHLWRDGLPLQPLAILHLPASSELFSSGARAVITSRRGSLIVLLRTHNAWPDATVISTTETPAPVSDLELALPGDWLATLPADIASRWQAELWQNFALTESQPAIAKELSQYPSVALRIDKPDAAIGARSSSYAFSRAAEEWLADEQGYRNPTTVAFRLPDGTLGYEKRPTRIPIVWHVVGDGRCRTTTLTDYSYWLCQAGEVGVLARTEASAHQLLDQLRHPPVWRLRLGPNLTSKLSLLPYQTATLELAGEDQVILRLDTAY